MQIGSFDELLDTVRISMVTAVKSRIDISDEKLEDWLQGTLVLLVEEMYTNPDKIMYRVLTCGNVFLIVFAERHNPGNYSIEIIVTKNYKHLVIDLKDENYPFKL